MSEADTESPRMNVYPKGWAFDPRKCPCDAEFVEYLTEREIRGKTVFHFGTGMDHVVGVGMAALDNVTIGITASVDEINAYRELITERPELGKTYVAYFGDIYLSNARLLPPLDVVFLPHLSEFVVKNPLYGQTNDRGVLDVLDKVARPGALFIFYSRSRSFRVAEPIIRQWAHDTRAHYLGEYKFLTVYRKL